MNFKIKGKKSLTLKETQNIVKEFIKLFINNNDKCLIAVTYGRWLTAFIKLLNKNLSYKDYIN